jgi:hypothetical protein
LYVAILELVLELLDLLCKLHYLSMACLEFFFHSNINLSSYSFDGSNQDISIFLRVDDYPLLKFEDTPAVLTLGDLEASVMNVLNRLMDMAMPFAESETRWSYSNLVSSAFAQYSQ